jgi:hypothetical protein
MRGIRPGIPIVKVLRRFELHTGSVVLRYQDEVVIDAMVIFSGEITVAVQVPLITMAVEEVTFVHFDDALAKMGTTSRRSHVFKVELSLEVSHLSKTLRAILDSMMVGSIQGLAPEIASKDQLQHGEKHVGKRCCGSQKK